MKKLASIICSILIAFSIFSQEQDSIVIPILSDWNDTSAGVDGWSPLNAPALEYQENGGNTGGFIKLQGFTGSGFVNDQNKFTGNYSQKNYNHISLDIMFPQNLPGVNDGYKATITVTSGYSGGKWNYYLSDVVGSNSGVWQHFEIAFDPAWSDEEAVANGWSSGYQSDRADYKTFNEVMVDVTSIAFKRIYVPYQIHYFAMDNFELSYVAPEPSLTPEMIAAQNAAFSFKLSDWNDTSAGVDEWQSTLDCRTFDYYPSGGNSGGYVLIYGHPSIGIETNEADFTGNYVQKNCNLISLDVLIPQELPVITDHNKGTINVKSDALNFEWRYFLTDLDVTKTGIWQHLEIPFNSNWSDQEAVTNGWHNARTNNTSNNRTFNELMEQVSSIGLSRYYDNALHYFGIDNFKLSKIVSDTPAPEINTISNKLRVTKFPANRPVQKSIRKPIRKPLIKSKKKVSNTSKTDKR